MSKTFIFLVVIFSLRLSALAQVAPEPQTLVSGQSVEREIAGGQTHTYQITLTAGQFMRVVVEHQGIDLGIALMAPNGNQIAEANVSRGAFGLEPLSHEAAVSGDYQLVVRPVVATRPKGDYQVRLEVKAAATAQDKQRITAERLLAETARLSRQGGVTVAQTIEKAQQALPLWRELADRYWEAHTLHVIGIACASGSKYDQAIEYYKQSLAIRREIKDLVGQGYTINDLGIANMGLSRYETAIEYYQQALGIYREVKNRIGEADPLSNLGAANYYLSRYENAIEYFEQSLAIRREMKDRSTEGMALSNLGSVYLELGLYEKAIECYEQALAISRETKNRAREGIALNNLGEAYELQGRYEKAMERLEQALAIKREVKNRDSEAITLKSLGIVFQLLGRYGKALECLEQALAIYREIKNRAGEGAALNSLGIAYRSLKRLDEAISHHEQAVRIAREVKSKANEASALNGLMLDWKARNLANLAIYFGKQSVNAYQEIRSNIRSLDAATRQSFLKSKEQIYRDLADLLIAHGRLPEAEQVIRMLKEEEYFEYIRRDETNSPKAAKAALTPEEAALDKRYREIADQLTEIGTERGTLLDKKGRSAEEEQRLAKLETDLIVAGQAFQKFLEGLATEMGNNADTSLRAFQLRESQGLMEDLRELGKGVVALYTLVGEEKYRVILTTAHFQKGYEYPIKAADLNRKVLGFRAALQNPKLDPLPLAQELYRILLGPVARDLAKARAQTVMWSLDGVLRYVPVSALNDGKQYLVEQYSNVVFTPASQARLKDTPSRQWNALGLGVTKAHGEKIPALPGVMEEMHGIIKETGRKSVADAQSGVLPGTIKLDEAFTQDAMLTGLRQRPSVVHVASHFQFSPGNETNSALLLGDGSFLSLAQIKSLPNVFGGVELLTLSACNTATGGSGANGKEVEGFGVLAQRQGAKAVVASLWPVADRSTKELMQDFYRRREATAGTSKAAALRRAQLDLLHGERTTEVATTKVVNADRQIAHEEEQGTPNKPRFTPDPKRPYAHPYFWAPFILIGNWR